ncbi:PTS IIA-like nitrogen regulatory protein PtsN [Sphingomonas yabuuchiae]|uniref:PTS IIA-like nitrogen regulatory protein PtsN n=1 Tax=Sphingomonas yabuuchiae TaxID=172044 RepID=UPI001F8EBAEB|nr:PTS IIA-like nitrogen regulatory protein PtsN [uncultured Sphingomonas sp.]HIV79033.1 PTS IIA-like nitrogen regulatory protein PtsN [Candidatus Sphingomonas excrementigallinarum]
MNDFSDLLRHDTVLAGVTAANKKTLFQALAAAAAGPAGRDAKILTDVLLEREKLGSTGFGGGVAIPHGKLEGLTQIVGVFARLAQPVDFQAVDDMPVDLVFAMFSPADAGSAHLKALARISRRLRDKGFVAKLRGAGSTDAIWALLTQDEARDAAA